MISRCSTKLRHQLASILNNNVAPIFCPLQVVVLQDVIFKLTGMPIIVLNFLINIYSSLIHNISLHVLLMMTFQILKHQVVLKLKFLIYTHLHVIFQRSYMHATCIKLKWLATIVSHHTLLQHPSSNFQKIEIPYILIQTQNENSQNLEVASQCL